MCQSINIISVQHNKKEGTNNRIFNITLWSTGLKMKAGEGTVQRKLFSVTLWSTNLKMKTRKVTVSDYTWQLMYAAVENTVYLSSTAKYGTFQRLCMKSCWFVVCGTVKFQYVTLTICFLLFYPSRLCTRVAGFKKTRILVILFIWFVNSGKRSVHTVVLNDVHPYTRKTWSAALSACLHSSPPTTILVDNSNSIKNDHLHDFRNLSCNTTKHFFSRRPSVS